MNEWHYPSDAMNRASTVIVSMEAWRHDTLGPEVPEVSESGRRGIWLLATAAELRIVEDY